MNTGAFFKGNSNWLMAGGGMTFASCFGQTFFIAIFAEKIMQSYGISDGQWATYYALGTTASGLLMIYAGGLSDRFRAGSLITPILLLLAGFCTLMAVNNSVWLLPVIIFGLRFCGQGMLSHLAVVTMSRWFTRQRGRAISIATLGFSLGEALLPLIFVALMLRFDWHWLWILSAVICLLFILVFKRLLRTERTPASVAVDNDAVGMSGQFWTRGMAIRHWLFWVLAIVTMTPSMFSTALFFQQVHLANIKGWTHGELVALFPLFTSATVISMLIYGWLVDRFGANRLMPFYLIPLGIGYLVIAGTTSLMTAAIGFVLVAIMQGGNATVAAAFWSEVYGTRYIGAIKAAGAAAMVVGSAIGPWISGNLIDSGMDFAAQMPFYAVYIFAVSAMMWLSCRLIARHLPVPA